MSATHCSANNHSSLLLTILQFTMKLFALIPVTLCSLTLVAIVHAQDYTYTAAARAEEWPELRECPPGTERGINECLKLLLSEIRPLLAHGIPQWRIPPLDPLRIKETSFKVPVLGLDYIWRKIVIDGASKYKRLKVHYNAKKRTIDFDIAFRPLHLTANYYRSGTMLPMNLWQPGKVELDLHGYKSNGTIFMEVRWDTKDGKPHWDISDIVYDASMDSIHFNILNFANGNPAGEGLLAFVNANAVPLYKVFAERGVKQHVVDHLIKTGRPLHWIRAVLPLPKEVLA